MQLLTPLGDISLVVDDISIEYEFQEIELSSSCSDVDGRYLIRCTFIPDGNPHQIACVINNYTSSIRDDIESGERLELKSFYSSDTKLSIGMIGESGYICGERITEYDYDCEYKPNGVSYILLPTTKTTEFWFGISWINNCTDENNIQTWYGADPTMMHVL